MLWKELILLKSYTENNNTINLAAKSDQMHVAGGQILTEYVFSLARIFSSLLRYVQLGTPGRAHTFLQTMGPSVSPNLCVRSDKNLI